MSRQKTLLRNLLQAANGQGKKALGSTNAHPGKSCKISYDNPDPNCVARLNQLIQQSGAKIVVTGGLRPDIRDPKTNLPIDEDDLSRITKERDLQIVKALDPWNLTYTIRGTVFSTVEFNHNIVFKAHEDGHNVDGTCVCITTLDSYAGGRLVFPRYGYSAELGPRDLFLCDNNKELHGNLGPIVGNRFSVVAFLHDSVCYRASDTD